MKRRYIAIVVLSVALCVCFAFGLGGCRRANQGTGESEPPAGGTETVPPETEEPNMPPHEHEWGAWEGVSAATCTAGGKEKRECACGEYETRDTDPLGHQIEEHAAQEPTCTDIGWDEYETCSRCTYSTYVEIEALGHQIEEHAAQEPTCTDFGWDEYETCSRCTYSTYVQTDELGHDWGEQLASNQAEHFKQCSRCEEIEEPAAHTWRDNVCSVCSYDAGGSKGIAYTLINSGAAYEVSGIGSCTETNLVFPETYNGLPVVSIGEQAFNEQKQLTSVKIPDSVLTIGQRAFRSCEKLNKLDLGNGVQTIGELAFINAVLTELRIPASVCWIGNRAFYEPYAKFTSVIFEDPYGWQYSSDTNFVVRVYDVSSETLSDPAEAAKFVKNNSFSYTFRKI